ncbi:MAG: hypothetical protein RLZZ490_2528 [Cyanobacteriota bacterium]|jgi:hypothetical protein
MSEIESLAQELLLLNEEELTTKLGLLDRDLNAGVRGAASVQYLESMPEPRAGLEDLFKIGQNLFGPASAGLYKILCSDVGEVVKDSELAQQLTELMNQKNAEASAKAAALITPLLTSGGLPQSMAVMIGALIVKKLAKGSSDFICTKWQQNIGIVADP